MDMDNEIEENLNWEIKIVSDLDLMENTLEKEKCRNWLLGGENYEWKITRGQNGVYLMRR